MQIPLQVPALLLAAGGAFLAYRAKGFTSSSAPANVTSYSSLATSATNASMPRAAVIALSHGGGPLPVLGDPDSAQLAESLRTRVPAILGLDDPQRRPKAIVLVTAHWSESKPTISAADKHKLLYDYGGFPAESYRLKYNAPGSPEVARRVQEVLQDVSGARGLASKSSSSGESAGESKPTASRLLPQLHPSLDLERGWDHGVFIPMLLVRPQADIPIVQLSVLHSEDPATHFAMGQALGRLRDENIAIVGSGFASFHNLRLMFSGITHDPRFHDKLSEWNAAVSDAAAEPDAASRDAKFRDWRSWPAAYATHPQGGAEHFMPLVVCAGAAGDGVAAKSYIDDYNGLDIYSYYWQ